MWPEPYYLRVSDCVVNDGIAVHTDGDESGGWARVVGCTVTRDGTDIVATGRDNEIVDCTVVDGRISVHSSEFSTVINCVAHEGISVSTRNWHSTVLDCTVVHGGISVLAENEGAIATISRNELHSGGISVIGSECRVRGNSCSGSEVAGVSIEAIEDGLVDGNVLRNCKWGIDASGANVIAQNTIVDCVQEGIRYLESSSLFGEVTLNVVVGCGTGIAVDPGTDLTRTTCNDVWGNGVDWGGVPNQTGAHGNISEDPLFCGASSGNFTIASTSVCLPGNHATGCNEYTIGALGLGCGAPAAVPPDSPAVVPRQASIWLSGVWPTPARSEIHFELIAGMALRGQIYLIDAQGRRIAQIFTGELPAGRHEFQWMRTSTISTGPYFLRVLTDQGTLCRKVLFMP